MGVEDRPGPGLLDSFFDKAEALFDGIEKAIVPKEGLWQIEEIYDSEAVEGRQTTFLITDGKNKVECWDKIIAKRVCDGLNG